MGFGVAADTEQGEWKSRIAWHAVRLFLCSEAEGVQTVFTVRSRN